MCPFSAQRLFTFEQIYKVLVGLKTFLRLRHLQGHQGKSKIRKVKRQSVFLSHQHQKLRLTSFHDFIRRWSLHLLERRFLLSEPLMHVGKLTSMSVFPPLIRWCGWEVWARPKMSRLLYADQDSHTAAESRWAEASAAFLTGKKKTSGTTKKIFIPNEYLFNWFSFVNMKNEDRRLKKIK